MRLTCSLTRDLSSPDRFRRPWEWRVHYGHSLEKLCSGAFWDSVISSRIAGVKTDSRMLAISETYELTCVAMFEIAVVRICPDLHQLLKQIDVWTIEGVVGAAPVVRERSWLAEWSDTARPNVRPRFTFHTRSAVRIQPASCRGLPRAPR